MSHDEFADRIKYIEDMRRSTSYNALLDRVAIAGLEPQGNVMPTPLVLALTEVVKYAQKLSQTDYRGNTPAEHLIAQKIHDIVKKELG